ncbi:ATP-binding region ATPase domain protein [Oscillatoria nigro-viridis PCC 7112]|uniref:ATP-binding region ATPase domain protein n=1 Tax=Phormidium nigroviride PCC 7112 TaxID=179408 RepID=K9VJS7_9CYAN|nr:ATP-binding region ATPase domain protein [Oscillatoria nigro-viridis PCC 7112]
MFRQSANKLEKVDRTPPPPGSIALQNHPLPECRKFKANFVLICNECIDKIPPESYDWSTDWVGK